MPALPIVGARAAGGDRAAALLPILGAIGAGLVAAFVAATMDPLIAVLLAGGLALVLLSVRWPLLSLFVFVALIPIEETINIGGIGTLSRWAGIAFACVYGARRFGRLTPGALPVAGWAYVGWAVLSMLWAQDPSTTFGQLQTLIQLAVIGYLVADVVIHDPSAVRSVMWVYSASATVTAALGVVDYLLGGSSGRVAALANQNPAQFATILLPAMIYCLYQVLEGRRVVVSAIMATLCTGAIALSGTRSVWLGATVVIFLLIIPRLGLKRAGLALLVVGVILFVTVQIPGVSSLIVDRTETATSSGGAGRTDIWSVGFRIISSSPVIGVGFANFPVAFTSSLLRAANVSEAVGVANGPHNIVIGTTGELGIIGLALLALFLGPLVLRRGWGPDANVVQAMLASLMVNALFIDILSNRKQVWVIIGLAAGLAYLAKQVKQRVPATPETGLPLRATLPSPPGRPVDAVGGATGGST